MVTINTEGKVALALFDGTYCVLKDYDEEIVVIDLDKSTEAECTLGEDEVVVPPVIWEDLSGASYPELSSGMIPIVWNEDEERWEKADLYSEWYNYDEKKWANVVLVTNESRSTYQSAEAGTPIVESDVLAYLVWIPRYRYQLFNVESTSVTKQLIEIEFESKETPKSEGTQNGDWITHPAFTFGDQELDGIWIGKFETGVDTSSACYINESIENCNNSNQTPIIKPNIRALRYQNLSNQFLTSLKFSNTNLYGLTSSNDSHMMKNTEWGAVTYLTNSQYGQGSTEVYINNSGTYVTGCAGNTVNASSFTGSSITGCESDNTYNTLNGQKASTTGNIYGVYDMSGGSWEYVMGVMKYTNGVICSGYNAENNSGFNGPYCNGSGSLTGGVELPDSKYYDVYNHGTTHTDQTAYNRRILGDATSETRGWNNDSSNFVGLNNPWFQRGGRQNNGSTTGPFSFYGTYGHPFIGYSFRVVVLGD